MVSGVGVVEVELELAVGVLVVERIEVPAEVVDAVAILSSQVKLSRKPRTS